MVNKIDADLLLTYKAVTSGIVTDSMRLLKTGGWMDEVQPLNRKSRLVGRARTLRYAPATGFNQSRDSIYEVMQRLEPGDVLVLASGGVKTWLMGENMCHFAMYQGAAGVVTDARLRDVPEISEMDFPVFCTGAAIRATPGLVAVDFDLPITCGGAFVESGDLIVGDGDGITVVPQAALAPVAKQVEYVAKCEEEQEAAIRDRVSMAELKKVLAKKKEVVAKLGDPR